MFKALYKLTEKIRPAFEEGGKLHAFHSVYDGFETFLFTPNTTAKRVGAQIHDGSDSKRTMILVVLALVPAMLFGMYNVGYQHLLATGELVRGGLTCALFWKAFGFGFLAVLPYILVSYIVGLGIEFTVAQWKKEEIQEGFLVTGFLIPLIVPINTPLWMVAIATAFAVIFAKEVFGGTGYNIFNVALITRAFLFFAYPTHMTGDQCFVRTGGTWGWDGGKTLVDGFSGATPLTQIATTTEANLMPVDFWTAFNGLIPGSVGETCCWAILLGALLLLTTGVASWKTMLSIFVGGGLTALLFNVCGPDTAAANYPWYMHLVTGGFAFGAVFMATDPVTSARTECGKWIYGFLIGFMAVVIRVLNPGYPEGMMLAILLMNAFAPLIDWCVVQVNIKHRMKRNQNSITILIAFVSIFLFNSCQSSNSVQEIAGSETNNAIVSKTTTYSSETETPAELGNVLPAEYAQLKENVQETTNYLLCSFYNSNAPFSEDSFYALVSQKNNENPWGYGVINSDDVVSAISMDAHSFYEVIGKINRTIWQLSDTELSDAMIEITYDIRNCIYEQQDILYAYLTIMYYSHITIVQHAPYDIFIDEFSWRNFACNIATGAIGGIYGVWAGAFFAGPLGGVVGAIVSVISGATLSTIACVEPPEPVKPEETEGYRILMDKGFEVPSDILGYTNYLELENTMEINVEDDIYWCFPQYTIGFECVGSSAESYYAFQNAYIQQVLVNYQMQEYYDVQE